MRCKLKICGVTQASDAYQLVAMGIDAIGINFWKGSKRYISPENAKPFLDEINGDILRVGVFVDEDISRVKEIYDAGLIDTAQLHGNEDRFYLEELLEHGVKIIQVIRVMKEDTIINKKTHGTNKILLDSHVAGYGGAGERFDWNLARKFIIDNPEAEVILAGGITSENITRAAYIQPSMIDVASGAEISPGIKDFDLIGKMLGNLNNIVN
jgi:phosphoribosylanthranilate isomerase